MPNPDDQILYCFKSQIKNNVYDKARIFPLYKDKKFTTVTLGEAIETMATFVFNDSTEILRDATEEIPWRTMVCEKDTFSCTQNRAAEVGEAEADLIHVAKLSETKALVAWLFNERVYVRLCVQNQSNGKWSPSSLTHQVRGTQNLKVRHFHIIGMSENVAVMGLIPSGDSSRQYFLRISLQGDSIYEQGEATMISDQFADYIFLCRLTNTKFMAALWGRVYLNRQQNQEDPWHGQTFVHEMEMAPFIQGASVQKQEFRQNRLAYYAGLGFLSATVPSPDALTMTAIDENRVVLARVPNYNNYMVTELIVPHRSDSQALVTDENLVHQTELNGVQAAGKVCSTILPSNLIVSCFATSTQVFCVVDKTTSAERLLVTPILNFVPYKMAIKKAGRTEFILLTTPQGGNEQTAQAIKFRYNTLTNTIVEIHKVEQVNLYRGTLDVFDHNYAVFFGNRSYGQNQLPRVTVQPCLISSGIAVARPGDEIIGISNTYPQAEAGAPVQVLIPADRIDHND